MPEVVTDDGEDQRVGEVAVERELHHVPAQTQQLHRLGQAHEDVTPVKEEPGTRTPPGPGPTQDPPGQPQHPLAITLSFSAYVATS